MPGVRHFWDFVRHKVRRDFLINDEELRAQVLAYGPRSYKPPPGAGLVFSCLLPHRVKPMQRGRRYAFLPFFYDEAAATVREANAPLLEQEGEPYRAHPSD
jgi:hypothetical protein